MNKYTLVVVFLQLKIKNIRKILEYMGHKLILNYVLDLYYKTTTFINAKAPKKTFTAMGKENE